MFSNDAMRKRNDVEMDLFGENSHNNATYSSVELKF